MKRKIKDNKNNKTNLTLFSEVRRCHHHRINRHHYVEIAKIARSFALNGF